MGKNVKWDFTSRCNLRCIHCLAGKNYFTGDVKDLSLKERLEIVDTLADADVSAITFLGGEPLVTKDIFPTAQYAVSKGIAVTLVTNGTLLDEARIDKVLDAGIQSVTVSLDGASATTHDQIRGAKSFERTITNIGKLVSRVKSTGSSMRIKVNTVVSRINRGEIGDMFDLCGQLGVDELSFLSLSEVGRATDHRDELVLTPAEMIDAAIVIGRKFNTIDKDHYPAITQQIAYPLVCDYIKQEHGIDMPSSNVSNICCFAAISLGYVTPDGYLFPCDKIVSDNYVGSPIRGATVERRSLLRHSFDEIWNSDYFVKMFELVVDDNTYTKFSPCSSCNYLKTRKCNPCPLFSMRSNNVLIDTCVIAQKSLKDDPQGATPNDGESDRANTLFSGFNAYRPGTNILRRDLYPEYENSIPLKTAGIRSFNKDGVAIIFNPYTAEYCRLDSVHKFMWDLVNGENSVRGISFQIEDVISEVRMRLGLEDEEDEANNTTKWQVAAYFKELSDAGFIKMQHVSCPSAHLAAAVGRQ